MITGKQGFIKISGSYFILILAEKICLSFFLWEFFYCIP